MFIDPFRIRLNCCPYNSNQFDNEICRPETCLLFDCKKPRYPKIEEVICDLGSRGEINFKIN